MDNLKNKKYLKYLILSAMLLLSFLNYYYSDLNSNIRQGMNVWEALLSGRFFQYYSLNAESRDAGEMIHLANYGMLLNIVYGIWQLPLFVTEKLIGGNILNYFPARLWGKSIHLLTMYTSAILIRKIAREMKVPEERAEDAAFLYLSAAPVILSALNAAQMDGIGLNFMLLALYFLMKEEYKRFLVFFIISVQFKDFASVFFLPVILYKEKNVFKALGTIAAPFVVSFLIRLPFSLLDPSGVGLQKSRMWNFFDQLTRSRVNLFGGIEIPLVFLVMGFICMYAYYKKTAKDCERRNEWYVYLLVAAIGAVLTCVYAYSYWVIYIVPFYLLLMLKKEKRLFSAVLLESFASMSIMVAYLVEAWGPFDSMEGMLADILIDGNLIGADIFSAFLKNPQYFGFWTLAFAAFFVWLFGFVYYMNPDRKGEKEEKEEMGEPDGGKENVWSTGDEKSLKVLFWLRAVGSVAVCNIMLIINFALAILR